MALTTFRFGPFELEGTPWQLSCDHHPVEAPPAALEVLAALLERPGSLWRRQELQERAGRGAFLTEEALFQAVARLRMALNDSPVAPEWIEAVPGHGYRFIGVIVPNDDALAAPPVIAAQGAPAPLTGRDGLLESLLHSLLATAGVWTLTGAAGVGKTRLAVELLQWAALPGGFVDLTRATTPAALRLAVSRALGGGAAVSDELPATLAALGPALLVLDHAEGTPLAEELASWVRAAPEARFLVTQPTPVGLAPEQLVAVPPLGLPPAGSTLDALQHHGASALLLAIAAGSAAFRPTPDDAPAIVELVALLGGVPLAIELAAPQLRAMTPGALSVRIRPYLGVLGGAVDDHSPEAGLRRAIATLWDLLGQHHRRALARLSQLPGPFPAELADAVLDGRGDLLLADLIEHRLVRRRALGNYDISPGVRAYVQARVAADDAIYDQLVRWYATPRLGGTGDAALTYARDESVNLEFALDRALDARAVDAAAGILRNLAPTLLVDGPAGELTRLVARVRALGPVPVADDAWLSLHDAEASLNREDGRRIRAMLSAALTDPAADATRVTLRIALELRNGTPAEATAALESSWRHSGLVGLARARWAVEAAQVLQQAGRFDEAEAVVNDAIPLTIKTGARSLHAALLAERGSIAIEQGAAARAQQSFDEVFRLLVDAPDRAAAARVLERQAFAAQQAGRLDEAHALLDQAHQRYRACGNLRGALVCLEQLGRVAQLRGDAAVGATRQREAARLARRLGLRGAEAAARVNLGQLLGALGQLDDAEAELLVALELQVQLGLRTALTLHNLGAVAAEKGDLALARQRFESALSAQRQAQNRRGIAITTAALGELDQRAGRYPAAIQALAEAFGVLRELGDRVAAAQVGQRLGTTYALAGDVAGADAIFASTLEDCRAAGLKSQTAATLVRCARAALNRGQLDRARVAWAEADDIARALKPAPKSLTDELVSLDQALRS